MNIKGILVARGAGHIGRRTEKARATRECAPVVLDSLIPGRWVAARSGPFYEGTGTGNSMRKLIQTVQQAGGQSVSYQTGLRPSEDAPILVAGCGKGLRVLYWKPRLSKLKTIAETAWKRHPRQAMIHSSWRSR